MIFIVLMVFIAIGTVNAAESINVSDTEDSNYFIGDDVDSLSASNKLEISNEVSISETNIVNSHDDNLGNYPNDEVLNASSDSEDNYQEQLSSSDVEAVAENNLSSTSSSTDSVVAATSSNNIVSTGSSNVVAATSGKNIVSTGSTSGATSKVSTYFKVYDTHYGRSSTIFDVILKDKNGNHLKNQKIILKVNKKSYSGFTNDKGVASIKTDSLKIGSYTVSFYYGGNSNHASSSLSKKIKVLSSVAGSDLTTYFNSGSEYKVTFWKDSTVLANTKVTFKLNGKTYTAKTNSKGVASIKVYLFPGKYVVTVKNLYSKEKVSHNIIVKKEKTKLISKDNTYILTKEKGSFKVVLKTKHNGLLKNKKVFITYNKKTVTSRTNEKGEAILTIPVLARGTYKISFNYGGSTKFYPSEGTAMLVVANPTTMLSSKILVMTYNDGSKFKVKLTDTQGNALAGKSIKFKINGKVTFSRTNDNGKAKLSLKNVLPGTHIVKYSYLPVGSKDYSHGSNRIIILKVVAKVSANDLTIKSGENAKYKVKVKDASGKLLKGVYVKSVINGKSYIYKTNANGVAKLKINKGTGYYNIKTIVSDPIYKSAPVTKLLKVKGTKIIAHDIHVLNGKGLSYYAKIVNEKGNPVKGKKVVFKFKGKYFNSKSNSKGNAWVNLGKVSKGAHSIKIVQGNNKEFAKIYVVNKVSLKDVLYASKTVKKFIDKKHKLPSYVKIGDIPFKTSDYLYLASKAIVNLEAGKKKDIPIKFMRDPTNPKGAGNLGYLKDYPYVAKCVIDFGDSRGKMPNSVKSSVGSIGYDGLVYTFSDALNFYRIHNEMPSYVKVSSFSDSSSSYGGVLNEKNRINNLLDYLLSTTNCDVDNGQIKYIVYKLTKNCKTEKEKANVIFDYVRDTISYSFYYDTRYGAVGTLNAGTGNCVDHAHILVAMYRAAGMPARYVHGTCTFSSGSTYGHVWAQVLVGDTWTVADATSTRNSLGYVANWNTNSYGLNGYYRSLPF